MSEEMRQCAVTTGDRNIGYEMKLEAKSSATNGIDMKGPPPQRQSNSRTIQQPERTGQTAERSLVLLRMLERR